jgi:hypothetical protein
VGNNRQGKSAGAQIARLFHRFDQDALESLEAEFCRAHMRPALWSPNGGPIAALGKLIGNLLAKCSINNSPADQELLNLLSETEGWFPVKLNAFREFRRGRNVRITDRARFEWIRRARLCLQLMLNGTQNRVSKTHHEKADSDVVIDRIIRFFFPHADDTLNGKEDWYFRPDFCTVSNPITYAEAESELRAMLHFAKHRPGDCQIVRVSGWHSFWGKHAPGAESPVSQLTARCVASGIETIFIVPSTPKGSPISYAEESALSFKEYAIKEHCKAHGLIERNVRIVALPWDFGQKFEDAEPDGRLPITFLTSFFRWNYYKCPIDRNGGVTDSLLVFRQLIRSDAGNFAFSPAVDEIKAFRNWLMKVTSQYFSPATTRPR